MEEADPSDAMEKDLQMLVCGFDTKKELRDMKIRTRCAEHLFERKPER